jgi:transposase
VGKWESLAISKAASPPFFSQLAFSWPSLAWPAHPISYEIQVTFEGQARKVYNFCMRAMASGAAFHRAYPHATQQAFLEAHELAFAWFSGVFRALPFDNLSSAVKKILRGHQREETTRFIAFHSHWGFRAEFCR